jgi:hypothetical protein
MEEKGKHLGSSDKGDCFIMMGYRNSDEFELEGCGEEKNSTPCVRRETNLIPHGNTSILHHPYFNFFYCIICFFIIVCFFVSLGFSSPLFPWVFYIF